MSTGDSRQREVSNEIQDGLFLHAVIQGRDITLQLPRVIQPALVGLPARSPVFTGRQESIDALLHEIAPNADCVGNFFHVVSGLGGVGKTELISQVAYEVLNRGWFPGGVLFIDLFGYDDRRRLSPERALVSLLQAIGVPEENIPEDLQSRIRLYRSILAAYAEQGSRVLILIDNASSAEQVSALLPSDGKNVALVTSRHTLSIGGRIHELQVLSADASIELLRNALRVARGEGDTRIDQDIENAYELSRLCGYLPLALQICAAILADSQMRPTASLVASLNNSHSRLDALQREERAVRAVFDLSYELLTEREKQVLGFISFSPGVDVSTAAAARLVDVSEKEVEEILLSLIRSHLLEHGIAWGRWRLHDLVRLYALEKVADLPGQEDAVLRLFDFYLENSRAAAELLGGAEKGDVFDSREAALEWLDAEYQNLIATVHISANQPGLFHYAAEIPHRLARYLDMRRLFNDWREVMEASLVIVREIGYAEFEANALDSLGMACLELQQIPSAVSYHREAVGIAREMGNEEMLAQYLNNMGNALFRGRDFQAALDAHSEAATLFDGLQNKLGFARASDNSASALRELGRAEEAIRLHQEAVRLFKESGATENEARALTHFGSTLLDMGRSDEAVTAQRRASDLLKELGLFALAGYTMINLSNALRVNGDLEGALHAINESLEIHESVGDVLGEGRALNQRGLIYTDLGEFERASNSFEKSLSVLFQFDGLIDLGYAYANLGRLYGVNRMPVEAIENLKKASIIFSACNAQDDALMVGRLIDVLSFAMPGSD
ncbi:tetratricopeptide (TPR) repeat protein [Streptomyces canus]|uniref:ATP-binding protein n=1 Tax=Streptomyces canus TaxID=58343 RepID=UPI00278AD450|nr:tetratricopeptide repeat protein [Streptomyces canus]MDQ0595686.1 tetratricopeptide (TPR) repeat protein [Streptomyces canus]